MNRMPNWLSRCFIGITFICFFGVAVCGGQEDTNAKTAEIENGIRKVSDSFVSAFNAGNAVALAQLFAENGEFVDLGQLVYQGRDAVQEEFAATFDASPGNAINIEISSIRQLGRDVVVEDGQATIARDKGPAFVSRYTAVHIRENGNWKIASLRDLDSVPLTSGEQLTALQWLIGDWVSESADGVVEQNFYWSEDGNFILGEFQVTIDGKREMTGNQRLAWDAQAKQIRGWIFDSDGSHLQATWTELDDRWMIKVQGVNHDGTVGSATNYYLPIDENQIVWKSTQRVVDGQPDKDIEIKMTRRPPAPKKISEK